MGRQFDPGREQLFTQTHRSLNNFPLVIVHDFLMFIIINPWYVVGYRLLKFQLL